MGLGINTHYEILGRRGTTWTIVEVINDRERATERAQKIWESKRYTGIRVLKETYNKHDHDFRSVEIFSRGAAGKTSKYDQSGEITPCLTPDDLYSADGRRSIWELLGNTLTDWRITPTELLHNLEHYYKLYNAGTKIQNAVQRTAVSFTTDPGSIQERMRKIYKVIDLSVDIMKKAQDSIPSLEMGRLNPVIKALDNKSNKRFLLMSSLAEYLRPAATLSDKFGRVAIFLANNRPKWVNDVLDQYIAEFLQHQSVLDALLGEKEDRGAFMIEIAHLQAGKLSDLSRGAWDFDFTDEALRLNGFLAEGKLPLTSHVLFDRLKTEILSSKPIRGDGLIAQLRSLGELHDIVQSLQKDIHALDAINDDLFARAGRLINSQSIGDLLNSLKNPLDQVHALLDLEAVTIGMPNKRLVANFILPILSRPEYETVFMGLDNNPIRRMNELVALQQKVMAAELTEMHRRKIGEKLDSFCRTILDNTQILKKIHMLDVSMQEKAIKVLNMLADNYFTEGECRDRAEQQARVYMRQFGFTEGLIKDLGRKDAEKALLDFRDLLERAGIKKLEPEQADPGESESDMESEESDAADAVIAGEDGAVENADTADQSSEKASDKSA